MVWSASGNPLKLPLKLKRKILPQRVFFTQEGTNGMLKLFKFREYSVKEKAMKTKCELTGTVYQGGTRCLVSFSLCQDPQRGIPYILLCS